VPIPRTQRLFARPVRPRRENAIPDRVQGRARVFIEAAAQRWPASWDPKWDRGFFDHSCAGRQKKGRLKGQGPHRWTRGCTPANWCGPPTGRGNRRRVDLAGRNWDGEALMGDNRELPPLPAAGSWLAHISGVLPKLSISRHVHLSANSNTPLPREDIANK
jgi:hypothetical protein